MSRSAAKSAVRTPLLPWRYLRYFLLPGTARSYENQKNVRTVNFRNFLNVEIATSCDSSTYKNRSPKIAVSPAPSGSNPKFKIANIANRKFGRFLTGAVALLTNTLPVQNMHFDQCLCGSLPVLPVQPPEGGMGAKPEPCLRNPQRSTCINLPLKKYL